MFRRRRFFTGTAADDGLPDIAWLSPDGTPMGADDWDQASVRPLAVFLNGDGITEPGLRGEEIVDDSFLLMLNPGHEDVAMTLPDGPFGDTWQLVLDTNHAAAVVADDEKPEAAGAERVVVARSVVVMRRV